jgi:glycosyltransferase involved in cell wall biosynthesis
MLSIANVCLSDTWGATEESALWWAEALAAGGHEVNTVVTEDSRLSQEVRDRALRQITVPRRSKLLGFRAPIKIRSYLMRHPIDVVQVHRSEDLRAVYPGLIGPSKVRLFLILSDLPESTTGRGVLGRLVKKKISRIVVPTLIGKSVVSTATGLPDERIAVIPPGFDPAAYEMGPEVRSRVRTALNMGDEHVVVGSIGWIDREKGQYELLEAARTVLRSHSSLRLVIAGDPGSGEGEKLLAFMRARAREYHLDEVVKFMPLPESAPGDTWSVETASAEGAGSRGALLLSRAELLSALDIFVMPSLEENFSRPLAEAMLSGLACVGTEAGGTPEVLEDGKAGLLTPSGSADGIARSLGTLFENPDLRGILGTRARKSARDRFDIERTMQRVEALYPSQ